MSRGPPTKTFLACHMCNLPAGTAHHSMARSAASVATLTMVSLSVLPPAKCACALRVRVGGCICSGGTKEHLWGLEPTKHSVASGSCVFGYFCRSQTRYESSNDRASRSEQKCNHYVHDPCEHAGVQNTINSTAAPKGQTRKHQTTQSCKTAKVRGVLYICGSITCQQLGGCDSKLASLKSFRRTRLGAVPCRRRSAGRRQRA